jgi:hypothetical protein
MIIRIEGALPPMRYEVDAEQGREQVKARALLVSSRETQAFGPLGQPLASASRFESKFAPESLPTQFPKADVKQPKFHSASRYGPRFDPTTLHHPVRANRPGFLGRQKSSRFRSVIEPQHGSPSKNGSLTSRSANPTIASTRSRRLH